MTLCRRTTPGGVGERERSDAAERRRDLPTAQEAQAVHALPDDDPRAGVRQQLVHHATEALGDRLPAAPHRATGQGLVSEPTNEAQEAQRARQENDIPRRRRRSARVRLLPAVYVITFCAPASHVASDQRAHMVSAVRPHCVTSSSRDVRRRWPFPVVDVRPFIYCSTYIYI